MSINNYLNDLGEQKSQEESKILVVKNPVVDVLFERYSRWLNEKLHPYYESYPFALKVISDLNYTSKDVELFFIEIKKQESHHYFVHSGLFLSALINKSCETDFKISTAIFDEKICWMGYLNEKNLYIKGDVGNAAFRQMSKGKVLIEGNVRWDFSEELRGGVVHVYGVIEHGLFAKPLNDKGKSKNLSQRKTNMAGINDYLRDLGEQDSAREKEIKLVHNPSVDSLCELFEKCLNYRDVFRIMDDSNLWAGRGLKYTSEDITEFSLRLKMYENKKRFPLFAGIFLSLLIRNSEEKEFKIITEHLSKNINCLGYNTTNKLILIKGNVGDYLGQNMFDGTIVVERNAGLNVGDNMWGRGIYINGSIGSISNDCKVRIYQNRKLIWPE